MKNFRNVSFLFFSLLGFAAMEVEAQSTLEFDLSCEIDIVYPARSISHTTLHTAQNLFDLNKYYKDSWVRKYNSVEITTIHDGVMRIAKSKSFLLSEEQKKNISASDIGQDISVYIQYIPENTLSGNEEKEIRFSFVMDPETPAEFPGGTDQMKNYLDTHVVSKVIKDVLRQYHLSAVSFTVNELGQIVNAEIAESSSDEKTDALLLEAICNMPRWKAAKYSNGLVVPQDFVLTIGDRSSCVLNYFNIHEDLDNRN